MNTDLHYKLYKMQVGQILGPAVKNRRIRSTATKDMWPLAARILILWTILSGAISRLVLMDVLIPSRPL